MPTIFKFKPEGISMQKLNLLPVLLLMFVAGCDDAPQQALSQDNCSSIIGNASMAETTAASAGNKNAPQALVTCLQNSK